MKRKILSAFLFVVASLNLYANNSDIVFSQSHPADQYLVEFTLQPVISDMDDTHCFDVELKKALNKALENIPEGSRIAINQIRIAGSESWNEYDCPILRKAECKDFVVEILLDYGYKVVAKEYLEKLYDEQNSQQSGIYNERTTVKTNNFSAVGYFLNVRETESAVRVQIIDVSTGEYVANVNVEF